MSKKVTRMLKLYAIHAFHDSKKAIDYQAFFDRLIKLPQSERFVFTLNGQRVSISQTQLMSNNLIAIRFINQMDGFGASFFNPTTRTETNFNVSGSFPASAAWLFVDPQARLVMLEKRRPGVPLANIEKYFQKTAQEFGYKNPIISLDTVATGKFIDEVLDLEIINEVTLNLHQPNPTWLSGAQTVINKIGQDSDAGEISLSIKAAPGNSLNKGKGIVKDLGPMVDQPHPAVQNLVVTGKSKKGEPYKRINMNKFQVQEPVRFDPSLTSEKTALGERARSVIDRIAAIIHPSR